MLMYQREDLLAPICVHPHFPAYDVEEAKPDTHLMIPAS